MPGNGQRRRRVTYVLPLPTDPLPLLHLPSATVRRPGDPRPLIKRRDGLSPFAPPDPAHSVTTQQPAGHPQHRLGVNALALDVSTIVVSAANKSSKEPSPKGILYAGGRDGLLSAWELGLPMRKRRRRYGHSKRARVARSMRWGDVQDDDVAEVGSSDEEDELPPRGATSSPDLAFGPADELLEPEGDHSIGLSSQIAYEERWEVDSDAFQASRETPPKSTFRQSVRPHSDWINAIALCNLNRTVISASSDRTVRAWKPHDSYQSMRPTILGQHTDYVKALAAPRNADWAASGGFDRMIKLWDINEGRNEPLRQFLAENSPSASVYCLATTPAGSLLASGSPENVVRLWDPRSGQQVGRLVGHSDNVRCLLISEDGSLLLSGSTDSDIKLWSTREQRCIETFSYHSSSVWSLFSNHPYLDVFYSGDRSGIVCKVDMDGCRDASDADCVVLLAEGDQHHDVSGADGINSIVAADDSFVWTATGSSTIMRWRDVASRTARLDAAPSALLRASSAARSPADVFDDHETDALLPQAIRKPFSPSVSFADQPSKAAQELQKQFEHGRSASFDVPDRSSMRSASPFAPPAAHRAPSLKLRGSVNGPYGESPLSPFSASTGPSTGTPRLRGLPYESMVPLVSLDDPYLPRTHLHGEPLATTWSTRSLSVHRVASSLTSVAAPSPRQEQAPDNPKERQAREQYELREEAADAVPLRLKPDEVLPGLRGLVASEVLNDRRHVVTADKRGGIALWDVVLGVCLGAFERSEVDSALGFAQGVFSNGQLRARPIKEALELVKERIEGEDATAVWSTIDVRSGCISVNLEETRVFEGEQYADEAGFADYLTGPHQRVNLGKTVLRALFDGYINEELRLHKSNQLPPSLSKHTGDVSRLQRAAAPGHISLSGLRSSHGPGLNDFTAGGLSISLATPALTPVLPPIAADQKLRSRDPGLTPLPQSRHSTPSHVTAKGSAVETPRQSEGYDYFSAASGSPGLTSPTSISDPPSSPTVAPNSGLMGKLRGLGRKSKSGAPEPATASREEQEPATKVISTNGVVKPSLSPAELQQLEILRVIFSKPLAPCPAEEAPPIMLPPHVLIIIAEEAPESASWHSLYRGTAASMPNEIQCIEMSSPAWLLDFLLGNRTLQREPIKVAFVMTPWEGSVAAGLKEMPEGNNRLSANRVLRIAKVAAYCADRIGAASSESATPAAPVLRAGSYTSLTSSLASRLSGEASLTAEDLEILIGDDVLPLTVTLAQALRFWQRKPGDLMLSFRLRGAPGDAVSRPS